MQLKVEEKETGREWTLTLSEGEACDVTERLMKAEFGDGRATLLIGMQLSRRIQNNVLKALATSENTKALVLLLSQRFELNMSTSLKDIEDFIKRL